MIMIRFNLFYLFLIMCLLLAFPLVGLYCKVGRSVNCSKTPDEFFLNNELQKLSDVPLDKLSEHELHALRLKQLDRIYILCGK
jgi:hypothetical protein